MMEKATPLLENCGTRTATWEAFVGELKEVGAIATPMVAVTLSQYFLQVVSMSMAGFLGENSFSSAAIATSFTEVTGFSLEFRMVGALETLYGQAYGAKQYRKLGIYTCTAILSLTVVCRPLSLLWIFLEKLLVSIGQDPLTSQQAGKYAVWLIPSLFPYAILQSLARYLQTQSLILPMLLCPVAALCFHIPVCWVLVFKLEVGNNGAALAIGLSYWVNVILLGIDLKLTSATANTYLTISWEVFLSIGEFFRLAVPSAVMVCLEWWSYELLILLSGLLPSAELETSVLSICFHMQPHNFYVPYSFGAAASTRVSNELGAGNPEAARTAVRAVMVLEAAEVAIASIALFRGRHVLGLAFSREK
ncbi:hypothetical protein NMG60_11006148 [Bertholletia excelsa]